MYNKNNMSIFNKTQNGQVSFDTKQQMNTKQKSILTMSFVKAGLGFLIIGVLSFLFGFIWYYSFMNNLKPDFANVLVVTVFSIAIALIIISSFISMIWSLKIFERSMGFNITVWIIFILGQSLGFSLIIFLFGAYLMLVAFGIGAFACFLLSLIGYFISNKTAYTLQKIEYVLSFVCMGVFFIFMIVTICFAVLGNSITFFNVHVWIYFVLFTVFILLMVISIIRLVNQIKNCSQFAEITDASSGRISHQLSWLFGYILLSQFIEIVWYIVYILIVIRGFRRV